LGRLEAEPSDEYRLGVRLAATKARRATALVLITPQPARSHGTQVWVGAL